MVKNLPANVGDARDGSSIPSREDPWRSAWRPTPMFLPGESHGQRSLVGTVHGVAELDMIEVM